MRACGKAITLLIAGLALIFSSARAQYIFIDADGDSTNTPADTLAQIGATTLDVWLSTDHNRNGTGAACDSGDGSLTINSYMFCLHVSDGTVAWAGYTNLISEFELPFGIDSSATELYAGFGSATALPPGRYRLGRITVSRVSGDPDIEFISSSPLSPHSLTCFGSQCLGIEGDNTLKLGVDWLDADGTGRTAETPEGPDARPILTLPNFPPNVRSSPHRDLSLGPRPQS